MFSQTFNFNFGAPVSANPFFPSGSATPDGYHHQTTASGQRSVLSLFSKQSTAEKSQKEAHGKSAGVAGGKNADQTTDNSKLVELLKQALQQSYCSTGGAVGNSTRGGELTTLTPGSGQFQAPWARLSATHFGQNASRSSVPAYSQRESFNSSK